ncbi:gamma-glutamyl-phosphate reductase, partial [Georgenia satyanarayanai]|nr:gamma-glutamyl-phosphate reductase [Georgenia satyanarayanai]
MPDSASAQLADAARDARAAARVLARLPGPARDAALRAAAAALRRRQDAILEANAADLDTAQGLTDAFRDRLTLNPARVEAMARGLEEIAAQPGPVGRVISEWT